MLKNREDVISLVQKGGIGVELGVAEGVFSERILKKDILSYLYSIDMYKEERGHGVDQYCRALQRLKPYQNKNSLLRMTFDEALDLFEDESLDFIYVDGYAHTAQENGATLTKWFKKLKPYGIFSGDDYHPDFRANVTVIDNFVDQHNLLRSVIDCHEPNSIWSEYPTWWTVKVPDFEIENKTVAIVGNNTKLFDQQYGQLIDSHDVVIRLNRCTTLFDKNLHQNTHGTRTDIWGVWRFDEYINYDIEYPKNIIQLAFWYGSLKKDIKVYDYKNLIKLIQMLNHENPSSGLMMIDFVSKKKPSSVSVFGFDWKETPTWTDQDRKNDKAVDHNFVLEKILCMNYYRDQLGFKFY